MKILQSFSPAYDPKEAIYDEQQGNQSPAAQTNFFPRRF